MIFECIRRKNLPFFCSRFQAESYNFVSVFIGIVVFDFLFQHYANTADGSWLRSIVLHGALRFSDHANWTCVLMCWMCVLHDAEKARILLISLCLRNKVTSSVERETPRDVFCAYTRIYLVARTEKYAHCQRDKRIEQQNWSEHTLSERISAEKLVPNFCAFIHNQAHRSFHREILCRGREWAHFKKASPLNENCSEFVAVNIGNGF